MSVIDPADADLRRRAGPAGRARLPDARVVGRCRGRGAGGVAALGPRPTATRSSGRRHGSPPSPRDWRSIACEPSAAAARTTSGPWLPEPVATRHVVQEGPAADPADAAELTESLELGFLIVLDALVAGGAGRVRAGRRVRRAVRRDRRGGRPLTGGLSPGRVAGPAQGRERARRSPTGRRGAARRAGRRDRHGQRGRRHRAARARGGADQRRRSRAVTPPDARWCCPSGWRDCWSTWPRASPRTARWAIEQVNCAPAVVLRGGGETLVLLAEREPVGGAVERVQLLLNPDKVGGSTGRSTCSDPADTRSSAVLTPWRQTAGRPEMSGAALST